MLVLDKLDIVLCLLITLGAFAKSAQLGLHIWLVDAMEGPTPVSALIHAATMVTAGVFLLLRFNLLIKNIYIVIGVVGGITSLLAGIAAVMQTDVKKLIAYSTVSQIGYMFIAIGVFLPEGALYHLTTHAFFKALLFLCSGIIIYYLGDEQDLRKMGGLFYFLEGTMYGVLVGNLAIMGFPFFSGFYSKDIILEGILAQNSLLYSMLYFLAVFSASCTILYSIKLYITIFMLEYKGSGTKLRLTIESSVYMFSILILTLLSIVSGYFIKEIFSCEKTFYIVETESLISLLFKLIPLILMVFLLIISYYRSFFKNEIEKWLFSNLNLTMKKKRLNISLLKQTLQKKFWFDYFLNKVMYEILLVGNRIILKVIEKGILEIFGPKNTVQFFYIMINELLFGINEKIKYTHTIYVYILFLILLFRVKWILIFVILAMTSFIKNN